MTIRWTAVLEEEGDVLFRVGREEDELVAEWPGTLVLRSDLAGARARFEPSSGAAPDAVERLVRGLGAALVRHLHGGISLHASTVAREGLGIALLGPSGAGKSTAAATLCHRRGFVLLRDDITPVELTRGAVEVAPADAAHSLCDDAVTVLGTAPTKVQSDGKVYVAATVAAQPVTLRHIVALAFDDALGEPTLEPLRGGHALEALVPAVVRFVVDEPARQVAELEALDRMLGVVRLHRLRRPRNLHGLDASAALIESLLLEEGVAR